MNSEETRSEPEDLEYSDLSRYLVSVPVEDVGTVFEKLSAAPFSSSSAAQIIRPVKYADELIDKQRSVYQLNISIFKLRQQQSEKIAAGIRVIDQTIKSSVRMYISDNMETATVRKTLQLLKKKYKRTQKQITEQFHLQFLALINPPAKKKIKQ